MTPALAILFLGASTFLTSIISGVLGMAGGMILLGGLLAVLPVAQAMVLHGITQLSSNLWRALLWHKFINWRCFGGYAAGALLAIVLLGSMQFVLSRTWVLIALGAMPFLATALPRRLALNVDRKGHSFACGLLSVSVQLISGVSGPLLDMFFVASAMDRKTVVATKASVQSLGHAGKIAYFGVIASSGTAEPVLAVTMIVCAILGTSASRGILERLDDQAFRDWTRRTVLGVAAVYLSSGIWLAI
jgi:uncharacterized membrane protein YfcA